MRIPAAVMVIALIINLPVTSADWLQEGYDASRASFTPEDGPIWPDVVFQLELFATGPSGWSQPSPVIVSDKAYLAGRDENLQGIVFRVGLSTGLAEPFAEIGVVNPLGGFLRLPIGQMASDGNLLYVLLVNGLLYAFDLETGAGLWELTLVPVTDLTAAGGTGQWQCNASALVVADDALFAACNVFWSGRPTFRIWRIDDLESQAIVTWEYDWNRRLADRPPPMPGLDDPLQPLQKYAEAGDNYVPTGISILGDRVVVAVRKDYNANDVPDAAQPGSEVPGRPMAQGMYLVLDSATGALSWWRAGGITLPPPLSALPNNPNWAPAATGRDGIVYMELSDWLYGQPLSGDTNATRIVSIRGAAFHEGDPASGMTVAPEGIYATSLRKLHLIDFDFTPIMSRELEAGEQFGRGAPVRTGNGLLIVRTGPQTGTQDGFAEDFGGLLALESRTLRAAWDVPGVVNCTFAVSDGLVVRWCADGMFFVLGKNDASIQIALEVASVYPAPGDTVRVDLGGTIPGAFGPATEFRAVWGDGSETEWQESPIFEHRFTLPEDAHARFYARNENQTSSQAVLFHVGQADPSVNILNAPFSSEYQETSFFLLGLLLTGLVALLGVYRAGSKRRRLHRELRDLEADVKRLHGTDACEPMLAERRARARSLFLQKKLEEAHASFLEKRIDEVQRSIRVGAVDEQMRFLSHGLVLRLKRLLADARVDALERADFLEALERERLPARDRDQVRRLVESWFLRDAEVGP